MANTQKREIAFVDPGVEDLQSLLQGMRPEVELVLLSSASSAPHQMARALSGRQRFEAIHILAHGEPGEIAFSAGLLSIDTLEADAADLAEIGSAINPDGELRLWSCSVVQGERGAAFVQAIAAAVGAKVAAASDPIGAETRGGSWQLWSTAGAGFAHPPITTAAQASYAGVLDTTASNTTITGNNSTNTLSVTGSNDKISDGNGTNTVTVTGSNNIVSDGNGTNTVTVTGNNNTVSDGNATNTITVTGNNNIISDGNGANTIIASGSNETISDGNGGNLIYAAGTSGTNTITDGNGTNVIVGGSGTDTINSGNGTNIIYGGAGNDTINVGNGTDTIIAGAGSDTVTAGNGSDLAIYALSDHYKITNGVLQTIAGDVDVYNGGGGTDTLRIVVTQAEYALVQSKLADYATWLAAHQGSSATYSFNFGSTTTGLIVNGFEALQVQVVNTGKVDLAPNATSATGSLNSLNLFSNTAGTSSNFTDTYKIVGLAAGANHDGLATSANQMGTSVDPSLAVAQYLHGTGTLPTSYTVAGTDGTLTVNADGTYSYAVTSHTALTDTFTLATLDQNGFVTSTTLTFGVPDHAPVVSGPVTGAATEDGSASALNALANASDADLNTTLVVTDVPATLPAGVSYNAATHSFTLDPSNAAYQHLAQGQTATVSVSYNVSDGLIKTAASVSWTVTGTNDAPVVTGAVSGSATEDGATGTLNALANAFDVDDGTTLSVTNVPAALPAGVSYNAATHSFTLDPSNAAYQHLAEGQTTTVSVSYKVSDGITSTPASVSWTVTGANDAPVVSGAVSGSATEDGATSTLNALANASDVDDGTTLSVTNIQASLPAGVSYDAATHSFTIDPTDVAFQHLAQGQTTTVAVSYEVSDGITATPAQVSWTVTGTNDAPTLAAVAGPTYNDTAVNDSFSPATGTLSGHDVDTTNTLSYGITNGSAGSTTIGGITYDVSKVGSFGTLYVKSSSGQYTYQENDAAINAAKTTTGESFTVTTSDGTASASQTFAVTVNGVNDTPTLNAVTGPTYTDTAANDTYSSATGTLSGHDVDTSDTLTYGITGGTTGSATIGGITYDISKAGSFGTLYVKSSTGQYVYQENDAAINAAKAATGESFTVTTSDGMASASQTFAVTVNGTPDSPTFVHIGDGGAIGGQDDIVSSQTGDAVVSGTAEAGDIINIYTAAVGGTLLGSAIADGSGNWSYTLTSGNIAALGQGSGKLVYADSTFGGVNSSPRASSFAFSIDTSAPAVSSEAITSATGIQNNTLNAGDVVSVTATFSETVNVSGTPQLALNIGGTTVQANYSSGTGSNQLVFTYTIQGGQNDSNGISINANAITLNSGTITDVAGNAATLTAASVADNANFKVDTTVPTVSTEAITSATGIQNNTLNAGDIVSVTATFSENVTVTGTPQLQLNIGGTLVQANYASGSGSSTLTFTYTILAGQTDTNGVSINANALSLNGGTITDAAGNAASLTAAVVTDNASFKVDTTAPTVSSEAITSATGIQNNTLNAGDVVSVTATFNENVTVTGTPQLQLNIGGTLVQANYASGSGGNALVFAYTILAGQTDTNGISISANALSLNGGTVTDSAGNAAILTAAAIPDNSSFKVDTTPPNAPSITAPNNTQTAVVNLNGTNAVAGDVVQIYNSGTAFGNLHVLTATEISNNSATIDLSSNLSKNTTYHFTANITDAAGNVSNFSTSITANTNGNSKFPAGTSGEPITLGLENPNGIQTDMTVTVKGLPDGWTVGYGEFHTDGSWTVQTSDVSSLFVSTPATFTGAVVLTVDIVWNNPDGTTSLTSTPYNVEAYAPGSATFAWSGDDTLTGSVGHDTFVFSQPIGHDVVHSFDVSADTIDLISYGWQSFADVQAHTADDANGNAVITLGDGQTITLDGVHAADLSSTNFEFDVTPTVENPGAMIIGDGAMLPLSGIIHNTGAIELQASGDDTLLQLIQTGIKLEGGGHVVLSDDDHNIIAGTMPNVTLDNVDNVISGAGQIGQGSLTLSNEGTIDATGTHALVIDTGSNVIANAGTLEATGSGGLVIDSAVENTGTLEQPGLIWANGGNVIAHAGVTGGQALISGEAVFEFGASASSDVKFDVGAAGTLQFDHSVNFTGTVSGFQGGNAMDLHDILFAAGANASYIENQAGTGGTLSVTDGSHTANITLLGQYTADEFVLSTDATGGTLIKFHVPDVIA
jgi:VCBS repeat-containing protein